MNNIITISKKLPLLVGQTSYTISPDSNENLLENDNTGGHYLSFGTGINGVCKTRAALLFIDKIVPEMQTPNNNVRTCTKAVQSDLLSELDKLFDIAAAPYYSQCLLRLLADLKAEDNDEYSDMAYVVSRLSSTLQNLEKSHRKSTLKISA